MTLKNQLTKTNWLLGSDKVHKWQVIDENVKHQNVLQTFNVFQLTIQDKVKWLNKLFVNMIDPVIEKWIYWVQ